MASKFDKVRESIMEKVGKLFEKMEYDVLRTGSQELCIPIIGWVIFIATIIYLVVSILIKLKNGEAEKYIEG